MNTVSVLAGIAAILLIIELLVGVIVAGAAVYFLRRGLIMGRQKAEPYVQQATEQVQRIEELTTQYSDLIIGTQVEAISTMQGLRQGLRALIDHD